MLLSVQRLFKPQSSIRHSAQCEDMAVANRTRPTRVALRMLAYRATFKVSERKNGSKQCLRIPISRTAPLRATQFRVRSLADFHFGKSHDLVFTPYDLGQDPKTATTRGNEGGLEKGLDIGCDMSLTTTKNCIFYVCRPVQTRYIKFNQN
jgi:hypothetical protein